MTPLLGLCLVAVLGCGKAVASLGFDCSTQLPNGRHAEEAEPDEDVPFSIITTPKSGFSHGQEIKVELIARGDATFSSFILQAQVPSGTDQLGLFASQISDAHVLSCNPNNAGDTLTNVADKDLSKVVAVWRPPTDVTDALQIEFDATLMDASGRFWTGIHSVLVRLPKAPQPDEPADSPAEGVESDISDVHDDHETETGHVADDEVAGGIQDETTGDSEPEEDRNDAELQAEQERLESLQKDAQGEALDLAEEAEEEQYQRYLEQQQQLLDEENAGGENQAVIDRKKELEDRQREVDEEAAESERMMAEEKRLHEERIRWEIQDKEEYEALKAQLEKDEENSQSWEEEIYNIQSGEETGVNVNDGSGAGPLNTFTILSATVTATTLALLL